MRFENQNSIPAKSHRPKCEKHLGMGKESEGSMKNEVSYFFSTKTVFWHNSVLIPQVKNPKNKDKKKN